MNVVILIGRLSKDNKVNTKQDGSTILNNSLAVKKEYKNINGEYDADFINIVAFGKTAEILANYTKKGSQVAVEGSWNVRTYQSSDGTTKYSNDCIVKKVTILESINAKEKEEIKPETNQRYDEFSDDDMPF